MRYTISEPGITGSMRDTFQKSGCVKLQFHKALCLSQYIKSQQKEAGAGEQPKDYNFFEHPKRKRRNRHSSSHS